MIIRDSISDYHQYADQYHNVIAAGDSIWTGGGGKSGIFGEDSGDNTESYSYTGSLYSDSCIEPALINENHSHCQSRLLQQGRQKYLYASLDYSTNYHTLLKMECLPLVDDNPKK